MPIVTVDGQTFTLRWKPEWDKQLLQVAQDYVDTSRRHGRVRWNAAEADGRLAGLPAALSLNDFSHHVHDLRHRRGKPGPSHPTNAGCGRISNQRRLMMLRKLGRAPAAKGYKPRPDSGWTPELDSQLLALVHTPGVPRRGKYINWTAIAANPASRVFPVRTVRELNRRYCWLKNREQRCADSLDWKRKDHRRYLDNMTRRRRAIRDTANKFLYSKLELR